MSIRKGFMTKSKALAKPNDKIKLFSRQSSLRQPKWTSAIAMEREINEYLKDPPEGVLTITGIALWLGFCDKQSMFKYQEKSPYAHLIKKARTLIENKYETKLHTNACAGAIFALKNMGWSDQNEGLNVNINLLDGIKEAIKMADSVPMEKKPRSITLNKGIG